jgi:hypothetical protein
VSNWLGSLGWIIVIVVITGLIRRRRAAKVQRPAPAPTPTTAGRRETGPRSDPAAGLALGHGLSQHGHHGGPAATSAFWAGAASRSEMDDDVDADVDDDLN